MAAMFLMILELTDKVGDPERRNKMIDEPEDALSRSSYTYNMG